MGLGNSGSLRVLAVGSFYPPYALGGYERIWKDVVGWLRDSGHEVKVLCSDWTANSNGDREDPDIRRELRLYVDELLDVRTDDREAVVERELHNRRVLDAILGEFRPNVVLLGPILGLPLSLPTRIHESGVRQLAFVADEWPKDAPKADPGQQLVGWSARLFGRPSREGIEGRRFRYGDVDQWVCASERAAEVVRRSGADPHTLTVLRPGPDGRRFARVTPKPWRGELLYAGPLFPRKGVEHAVRALAEAPNTRLTVAGAGDPRYVEKLTTIATELEVADRLQMLGEQHERMPELYAEADAVVSPSVWRDAWGLVPLEAMAVGRPVVATALGGAAEYLRDGENALVVPPSDPAALAAAVGRLTDDKELRAGLVSGGFATADEYRYDRFLDRLAGAVIALGETPAEEDEEESLNEADEQQPPAEARDDDTTEREEPRAGVALPETVGASAVSQERFAGVQGQAISPRPEPAPEPGPAPPVAAEPEREPEEAPEPQLRAAAEPEPTPAPEPEPVIETESTPDLAPVTRVESAPEAESSEQAEGLPEAEEWLPEGYEPAEPEEPLRSAQTAEWTAITPQEEAEDAPEGAAADPGIPVIAHSAGGGDAASRLAALEARVAELSTSAVSGIERSASERATLEGRVGELATSTVAGVERNAAELSSIEKRVSDLAVAAVALEERVAEIARSAVAGVERNAAQLATIDTRLGELAATAATAREHQGTELGSLQTRVGELAAFAELRGEGLGQRIDELERIVGVAEKGRSKSLDEVLTRLDSIEQRLSTMDSRLEGVEGLASEVLLREQSATEQARAAVEGIDRLEGLAKLNEATFEQLRTIGLSGTQAARLLAAREARSGFESVDELESIPGFPPALITELKQLVEG